MSATTELTLVDDGDANLALVGTIGEFARREIAPRVEEYDRLEQLPLDLLEKMGELGFMGGVIPVEYGGLGLDHVTFARVIEEVSKTCHVLATLVSMPSGLVGSSLLHYGTDEQKERWLRPLAEGRIFGAAGVTEPRSGSDVAGMTTTYRKDGSDYVINGAKAWISNLDVAEFVVTFATADRALRHQGITAFVIPRDAPGMTFHPYKDKVGFRPLSTGEVVLHDVRLGAEAVLGEEFEGFKVAMTAVERGRLGVAARSVGVTWACLNDSIEFAKQREAFGKSVADFQIVQAKIADMSMGLLTSRLITKASAEALDAGKRARKLISMAKLYSSDVANRAASDAMQIHGATGVSGESRVGRLYRDSKVLQIVEGSNDLHRALIGEFELGLRAEKD